MWHPCNSALRLLRRDSSKHPQNEGPWILGPYCTKPLRNQAFFFFFQVDTTGTYNKRNDDLNPVVVADLPQSLGKAGSCLGLFLVRGFCSKMLRPRLYWVLSRPGHVPGLSFLKTPGGTIQPWTPLLGLVCLDSSAFRETKAPSSKRPTWHFLLTSSTLPDPTGWA